MEVNATNTTKQYLKNYDGGILLPFTTLDCILSDEESDITGAEAIISSILSKDDLLIYEKNAEHNGDRYIHQSNLNGSNLYMLGVYNDGENNNFIKMHYISDDESSSNQYLGADGDVHSIGNGNGDDIDIFQSGLSGLYTNTSNPTWFTGKVTFDSSSCSISLIPNLNSNDFYVEGGALRVRTADHVRHAQVLVDSVSNNPINIGTANSAKLIKLVNGIPMQSDASINSAGVLLTLNNGVFKQSDVSIGGPLKYSTNIINVDNQDSQDESTEQNEQFGFRLIYVDNGIIKPFNENLFGAEGETDLDDKPSYALCIKEGGLCINRQSSIGANNQLIYLNKGEFKASDLTIKDPSVNESCITPIVLENGFFRKCNQVGGEDTPVYIDASGALREATSIDVNNLNKPVYVNDKRQGQIPYIIASEIDIEHSENSENILYKNKLYSIDDFVSNILTQAVVNSDSGIKAKILVAREKIIEDPSTGETEVQNKLKLGWERLPHSVEIEANTDPNRAFYLTGVYSGTPIVPINDTNAAAVNEALNDWKKYHDIENNLATKLEVAISGIYNTPDENNNSVTATGIYFKNCKLYQTSDARLKTFVSDLQDETDLLDHISTIKKGKFYWSSDKNQKIDIGVTAQTVEQYFPEFVDEDKGVKTVSYSKLSVLALAAIDKLNDKIKALEKEIEDLKNSK